MTEDKYLEAYKNVIKPHLGDIYPYHRLLLHAVDNLCNWVLRNLGLQYRLKLAKLIKYDRPVCSEWAYMVYYFLRLVKGYLGIDPDKIHDNALADPETWQIIYEGNLIT